MGWGRGRLQGEGSGVVGVGEELVLGDDPMGLHGRGGRGRFRCLGRRVLVSRVEEHSPAHSLGRVGTWRCSPASWLGRVEDGGFGSCQGEGPASGGGENSPEYLLGRVGDGGLGSC